ncbi:MAG TPA: hypothetical protein VMC09_10755 [Anaerolineales bacterium]|nr:hypothetical protein [Anaerolineales bacterium]
MKIWKWVVAILVLVSIGLLVASSLVIGRIALPLKLPAGWESGRFQGEHPVLGTTTVLVSSFVALITLFISGTIALYLFPKRIRRISEAIPNKLGTLARLMLMGFLIEVLILAVGVSSALMIGTFPLTILLIGGLFMVGFLGFVSLAYTLGRTLLDRAGWSRLSPLASLMLGVLLLFALIRIPLLGGLIVIMVTSLGLGAVIATHFGTGLAWNLNSLTEEVGNEKVG